MNPDDEEPVEVPIDGILDLHTFRPGEVKDLIPEYLHACREKGIFRVRIIHGKGTGALRRIVHSCLSRLSGVTEFYPARGAEGNWGATIVYLSDDQRSGK